MKQARREKERLQIAEYRQRVTDVDAVVKSCADDASIPSVLLQIADVLQYNPEYYTFWNHRKRLLLRTRNIEWLSGELALTKACFKLNPKSYWVWHHRRWSLELALKHMADDQQQQMVLLKTELKLCGQFLALDGRNFHCWDYRCWVVQTLGNLSVDEELKFTFGLISENFSNYSAWHYRSTLLPQQGSALSVWKSEFDLIKNALFTEPADQSAWLYHHWLCGQMKAKCVPFSYVALKQDDGWMVYVYFQQPMQLQSNVSALVDGKEVALSWRPVNGFDLNAYATSFMCTVPQTEAAAMEFPNCLFKSIKDEPSAPVCFTLSTTTPVIRARLDNGLLKQDDSTSILSEELANVQDLISLEDNCPRMFRHIHCWCLEF